jgi:hypothetical protein
MLQPAMGWIQCSACNASYESETKLREHQRMSHRGGASAGEPKTEPSVVQPETPKI